MTSRRLHIDKRVRTMTTQSTHGASETMDYVYSLNPATKNKGIITCYSNTLTDKIVHSFHFRFLKRENETAGKINRVQRLTVSEN